VRPADALGHLRRRTVSESLARDLRMGRKVPWAALGEELDNDRLSLVDPAGALVAVAEPRFGAGQDVTVHTLRVFGVPH
jgi:hypothetical protein